MCGSVWAKTLCKYNCDRLDSTHHKIIHINMEWGESQNEADIQMQGPPEMNELLHNPKSHSLVPSNYPSQRGWDYKQIQAEVKKKSSW